VVDRIQAETIVDGRYRVTGRIGSGGMADVYCAEDLQLGRTVALKILHRRFAEDGEFVERFRREASSAAGLQHQHVVSVYDRGEYDGTYYIAMEFLQGRSLKQVVIDEAPLDPDRAIDLTTQILAAARFAHKRGIIHRDLKPHNVIVDGEGRVKVTDFGIARAGASDMTETGSIMGTAQYLSPEQAQGHAVSEASDVYSVGIILFELLTGQPPFHGDTAVTIALKQVSEAPVAPSVYNGAVNPVLDAAVLRALAKDPAERFAGAEDFATALEAARSGYASTGAGLTATALAAVPATEATALAPAPAVLPLGVPVAVAAPAVVAPDELVVAPEDPRRWWIPVLAGLLLTGLVIGGLLLFAGKKVTVPGVVGADQAEAQQALRRKGFSTDATRKTADKPRGQVIGQDPAAGTRARKGSTVSLVVSDGPAQVSIPAVNGEGRRAVRRTLRRLGLRVTEREQPSDELPENHVIETVPGNGEQVDKGTTVLLRVSSGKQKTGVPSVVGSDVDDATAQLEDAGFVVRTREEVSDKDPGTVLAQSPGPGGSVPRGTRVTLTVAKAPEEVEVPDVLGETARDATQTLSGRGFEVSTRERAVDSEEGDGVVLEQSPSSGAKARRGARVTITVGKFDGSAGGGDPGTSPDPGTKTTPGSATTPGGATPDPNATP
jgi:beta-lactam-binding protein with PASTA domain/predicted Ser/Thr protein kinase